jgi:hypothetical protein
MALDLVGKSGVQQPAPKRSADEIFETTRMAVQPPEMDAPVREPEPEAEAPAESAEAGGNGRLSDDDVERVARRVVELMSDKAVRDVAWEVVPELAELLIRDRLRELESQVD